ncbi:MAG: LacI family DNA-binding transcriptional regulator, partial [Paracoccaceae bacterium]
MDKLRLASLQESIERPTTKDLAKAAGVSRATVDRVLNGREGVAKRTVERVNHAIEKLGFVRNLQAANLAKSQSYRFIFALPKSGDQFLQEILRQIEESRNIFAADRVWCEVERIDENDPHGIASFLRSLDQNQIDGLAIMAPETPQVRDAIIRVQERGIAALPFISNQPLLNKDSVGVDNFAAGATAGLLLGQSVGGRMGSVMVISESMSSRDSLERRRGFDQELIKNFKNLRVLPSLETYGNEERAEQIIKLSLKANPDMVAIYVMSSEARIPLEVIKAIKHPAHTIKIAHERTPFTQQALLDGALNGVVAQDTGHLVRSAIRRLKGAIDKH